MSNTESEPAPPMRITPAPTTCAPFHYASLRGAHGTVNFSQKFGFLARDVTLWVSESLVHR